MAKKPFINIAISTPSKIYHWNKIIGNCIYYWLHHRDTHQLENTTILSYPFYQPAIILVLIYIHLAISLLLPPIVILKYNSDYTGDCGVIKSRFICMIIVNDSNNPNICQLASYYYLQVETWICCCRMIFIFSVSLLIKAGWYNTEYKITQFCPCDRCWPTWSSKCSDT